MISEGEKRSGGPFGPPLLCLFEVDLGVLTVRGGRVAVGVSLGRGLGGGLLGGFGGGFRGAFGRRLIFILGGGQGEGGEGDVFGEGEELDAGGGAAT